ncbi:MAG: hypothetical protein QW478_15015 [Candidatus Micrarchaeaceae archaeon]
MKAALFGAAIVVIVIVVVLLFAFHVLHPTSSAPTASLPALPLEFNTSSASIFGNFSALSVTYSNNETGISVAGTPALSVGPLTMGYRIMNSFNANGIKLYNMSLTYLNSSVSYTTFMPIYTNYTPDFGYLYEEIPKNETTSANLRYTEDVIYFIPFIVREFMSSAVDQSSGILPLLKNSTSYAYIGGVKMLETKYTLTAPFGNVNSSTGKIASLEVTVGEPAAGGPELMLDFSTVVITSQGTINMHAVVNSLSVS